MNKKTYKTKTQFCPTLHQYIDGYAINNMSWLMEEGKPGI